MGPPKVLFLCTANSCRSQMAEALCRNRYGDRVFPLSAGVRAGSRVDPLAIAALAEVGIDASAAHVKSLNDLDGVAVDLVVTVCDAAAAECPAYSKSRRTVHRAFDDPPALARAAGVDGPAALPFYRTVRDEISAFVDGELAALLALDGAAEASAMPPLDAATTVALLPHETVNDGDDGDAVQTAPTGPSPAPSAAPISFFERYLSVWVLLCMIVGGIIGYYAPAAADALETAQFAGINAVVAVLLWVMILPMLVQIDFAALRRVTEVPAAVCLTTAVNYLVKPFSMYALARLFLDVAYPNIIPDTTLRGSYVAGLVLLAGAPCTAMVFVWSALVGGDAAYTLIQVAVNDLIMLGLYVPTCALLIGVSGISLPWVTIIVAVALFIAAPLAIAAATRAAVVAWTGSTKPLDDAVTAFKPVTIVALLAVLVLIFIFQGRTIATRPVDILLIAVPIIVQVCLNFGIAYAAGFAACIPHSRTAPAALIATSNFFELAVAVAISVYGPGSGAALATVVGVLVEVPLMLALVHVCEALRPALDARCASCAEKCAWSIRASEAAARGCRSASRESDDTASNGGGLPATLPRRCC